MEKKLRNFTITTDKVGRGLGYMRITDDSCYIHSLTLFMFIILWTTPVKTGKRQTARQVSNRCVEISGKLFDIKYYTDVNRLKCIWYRNPLTAYIKITDFNNYKEGYYVINSPDKHKDIIVSDEDVYLFNPDSKLEGYIKGNTFYAIKELSIG